MKIHPGLVCVGAAIQASASANVGLLFTSDAIPSPGEDPSTLISPNTARLLLARRLGLSQYHELLDIDGETLEILNHHGGVQRPLLSPEGGNFVIDRALVIVEGAEHPEDILDTTTSAYLSMIHPPSGDATKRLASDLLEQDRYRRDTGRVDCLVRSTQFDGLIAGINGARSQDGTCGLSKESTTSSDHASTLSSFPQSYKLLERGSTSVIYVHSLQGLTKKDGVRYSDAVSQVKEILGHYWQKKAHGESTILITPPSPKTPKRSTTTSTDSSSYGAYAMPLAARQQPPPQEEILHSAMGSSEADSSSSSTSSPGSVSSSSPSNPLPHGILPLCHASLDRCISTTNNCSGHGTPYLKSGGSIDCYACRCGKTSTTDSDGKTKTIQWGGPACQKKDVSVPFFLLGGISVVLIITTIWGIGLMASIGQEDLPSVIGAGVAGPRAQK